MRKALVRVVGAATSRDQPNALLPPRQSDGAEDADRGDSLSRNQQRRSLPSARPVTGETSSVALCLVVADDPVG